MDSESPDQDRTAEVVDRTIVKVMYKPIAMIASAVGATLASMLFGRVWRAVAGKREVPAATDQVTSWADVLPAAALHGIVFGVVKAMVDRAGAKEFERVTGYWPGKRSLR